MGAKQSKRSVDISGKEAEGGGEVAVAGAGGEGRVEQLADADALKPQLNGDAHIQNEQTDKEKELDSGTPENEKDATTEKEGKDEDEKEKEAAPVTNGETDSKVENGDSTPEDGKKPKKEKVKKKWSLRSISFSRKDKPKQEKKPKEEEPKTNGEPEKVPEETAEATPEASANEVAEEAKATIEEKDEKTPETPVTEPLTNGTSTPESSAPAEESAPAAAALSPPADLALSQPVDLTPSPPADLTPDTTPEPRIEPDQLPVNGLSLEEPKPIAEVEIPEETKPEPPVAETAEIVPAPEIPKEVCVERMPLLESMPPPLPANPPPSSVASFAATTMAPELTDASLANTADAAIEPISALPDTKDDLAQPAPPTTVTVVETPASELPSVLKETNEDISTDVIINKPEIEEIVSETPDTVSEEVPEQVADSPKDHIMSTETTEVEILPEADIKPVVVESPEPIIEPVQNVILDVKTTIEIESLEVESVKIEESEVTHVTDIKRDIITDNGITEIVKDSEAKTVIEQTTEETIVTESKPEPEIIPEPELEIEDVSEDSSLPPPPPVLEEEEEVSNVDDKIEESLLPIPEPIVDMKEEVVETNHTAKEEMTNGIHDTSTEETSHTESLKEKAKGAELVTAFNGGAEPEAAEAGEQPPPAATPTPQEPLPVSDKLADLISEVPDVPELNTDTLQETATDVAVAN